MREHAEISAYHFYSILDPHLYFRFLGGDTYGSRAASEFVWPAISELFQIQEIYSAFLSKSHASLRTVGALRA